MPAKKSLQERENELQSLLATAEGRAELLELAARYHAAGNRPWPTRTSVITYLLVHERELGLIKS